MEWIGGGRKMLHSFSQLRCTDWERERQLRRGARAFRCTIMHSRWSSLTGFISARVTVMTSDGALTLLVILGLIYGKWYLTFSRLLGWWFSWFWHSGGCKVPWYTVTLSGAGGLATAPSEWEGDLFLSIGIFVTFLSNWTLLAKQLNYQCYSRSLFLTQL